MSRSARSRQHARIVWQPPARSADDGGGAGSGAFVLQDCSKTGATLHNGRQVGQGGVALAVGDVVFLGKTSCLLVVGVDAAVGGTGADDGAGAKLTVQHSERGRAVACNSSRKGAEATPAAQENQEGREACARHSGDAGAGAGAAVLALSTADKGTSEQGKVYRDRAAERRGLHGDTERVLRREEYRRRQEVSERKARARATLEANLAAVDAGTFRADAAALQRTLHLHSRHQAHARPHSEAPASDKHWHERGAKMLKAMGWKEGGGLGRNEAGITKPIETSVQTSKNGLGLAAEQSLKIASALSDRLALAGKTERKRQREGHGRANLV